MVSSAKLGMAGMIPRLKEVSNSPSFDGGQAAGGTLGGQAAGGTLAVGGCPQ